MNYGWGAYDFYNTWYTVDALHLGDPDIEYMLINIVPAYFLGGALSGNYVGGTYRYVDLDVVGASAVFLAGNIIQMLPDMVVKGIGTTSYLKFYGSSAGGATRIYTNGDNTKGINLINGGMRMENNGSFTMRKPED